MGPGASAGFAMDHHGGDTLLRLARALYKHAPVPELQCLVEDDEAS